MWAAESAEMASQGEVTHDNNNTVKPFGTISKTNKLTMSTTTFGENNDNHNKLVKLNMHSKEDNRLCSKQVTIHVVFVVLALLAFLGIGVLLGYFIGKPEKCTGKLKNSIVTKFTCKVKNEYQMRITVMFIFK